MIGEHSSKQYDNELEAIRSKVLLMGGIVGRLFREFAVVLSVTILVSLFTKPRAEKDLVGLVYSLTERPKQTVVWYMRPTTAAAVVVVVVIALNIYFF